MNLSKVYPTIFLLFLLSNSLFSLDTEEHFAHPILLSHMSSSDLRFYLDDVTLQAYDNITRNNLLNDLEIKRFFVQKFGACFFSMYAVKSVDGKLVITASKNDVIVWKKIENGFKQLFILEGHKKKIINIIFASDGKTILTESTDKTINIWSLDDGIHLCTLPAPKTPIASASFSDDGRELALVTKNGSAFVWIMPYMRDPS